MKYLNSCRGYGHSRIILAVNSSTLLCKNLVTSGCLLLLFTLCVLISAVPCTCANIQSSGMLSRHQRCTCMNACTCWSLMILLLSLCEVGMGLSWRRCSVKSVHRGVPFIRPMQASVLSLCCLDVAMLYIVLVRFCLPVSLQLGPRFVVFAVHLGGARYKLPSLNC